MTYAIVSFHTNHVALGLVSGVVASDDSVTSSNFSLNWMDISMPSNNFRFFRVFYLPVSGPYDNITASSRRRRQSAQPGELSMDFTGTTGILTNLNGSVTYRIQVSAVTTFNNNEVIGDRSATIEVTTLEGGEQICFIVTCFVTIIWHYSTYCSSELKLHATSCSNW